MALQLTPEWFKGKKITVMGLGVHGGGLGSAKWLLKRGARVTVTDLRDEKILAKPMAELSKLAAKAAHPVRFVVGQHDEADFTSADMVIKNPAVPRGNKFIGLAEKAGVPVETDTGIFFSLCPFPITAVSGTKGKTTTTTLLAAIAKAHDKRTVVGGNIRISQLDALDRLLALAARGARAPHIVLELSSWQLEGLEPHRVSPHIGLLTNVKEDHLNRYNGMDDYARAKEINIAFQNSSDVAVVNADDARVAAMGNRKSAINGAPHGGHRLWFSVKLLARGRDGAFVRAGKAYLRSAGKETALFPASSIKLRGAHNIGNVLGACAAASAMRIPLPIIRRVVRAFRAVPYRLEDIATKGGVRFVNDTTATAPDASVAALKTFGLGRGGKKNIILIAGGADKDLNFAEWALVAKRYAKHLVLFEGTATAKMRNALTQAKSRVGTDSVSSMREAVIAARKQARRGDTILLSPACASFGIFLNEFDRGDQFNRIVRRLR